MNLFQLDRWLYVSLGSDLLGLWRVGPHQSPVLGEETLMEIFVLKCLTIPVYLNKLRTRARMRR